MEGKASNAFCMVRPPGHHARPSQAMGFCLFNSIAIGARYLQNKYNINRILIIDWDVHHGNSTEEVFYEDPEVFYVSLHQYPHYPGTGAKEDIGRGKGKGFNLNIPMEPGSGNREYIKAFQEIIVPKVRDFKPEFILISAGFDGHRADPLSSINLTEDGYAELTKITKELASLYAQNRLVSVLEGGYNLFSLASSVHTHLNSLLSLK
jgi:acetoin utilization deacetylase AcuC-like enzyme